MLAGRLPLPSYVLSDGTPMVPAAHGELAEVAGGVDRLRRWFVAFWPDDPATAEAEWGHYLSGQYVCLKEVSPIRIRMKTERVAEASEAIEILRDDPHDPIGRGLLGQAVDGVLAVPGLDSLLLPMTAYDRLRFGGPTSRERWVDAPRAEYLTPVPPVWPLRTERLVLRPFEPRDGDAFIDAWADESYASLLLTRTMNESEVREMVRRRTQPGDGHFVGLVVEHDGEVVGDSILILQGTGLSEGEIGWTILPAACRSRLRHRGRAGRAPPRLRALRPAPRRAPTSTPATTAPPPSASASACAARCTGSATSGPRAGGPTPTSTPSSARSGAGSPDPPADVHRAAPGGQLGLVDLVVVGDWLVRWRGLSPEQLVEACRRSRHRDSRKALAAAQLVRRDVDSPMETRLRLLLVLAGLPEPEVNLLVRDELGAVVRRYDLCYPLVRVAVEYDGRLHVEVVAQWEDDLERRADMDDDDWRLVVVIGSGIYKDPLRTLRRVHRVLLAAACPVSRCG